MSQTPPNAIININGQIHLDPLAAVMPVFDRSYLYGDSLYEVCRSERGKFLQMKEHLERLSVSARLAHMTLGQPLEEYARQMELTRQAFNSRPGNAEMDVYCRLVVSRGTGRIGFSEANLLTPTTYAIIVQPLVKPTEDHYRKGLKLQVVDRLRLDPRALSPAIKSGNYLNCVLAYLEATANGFDDALLCNADGHITEGTTFNLFYVKRGILVTSPLDIGILDGITRRTLLELAQANGIETREVRFPKERLYEADEVFWCSTLKIAMPVVNIDGKVIADGREGPMTRQMRELFVRKVG